ncbi:hypothetical protein VP01_1609g8 [Puccinia sorghi]|uniref:CBM21 domain-containing protein n=1 Tax=Puccinia sorghi TaxID=27349 RepID=A0A0L6VHA9_9BASI|nr:hypothetical protein VP01_1609g8 [Puccinia sorghi]
MSSTTIHHQNNYQFPIVNFNSPTPPIADNTDYFEPRIMQTTHSRPLHQKAQSEACIRLNLPHSFPSSASTTATSPMLRKKSGEVVRSSLKLTPSSTSSTVSACSSRSNSYSNPRSAPVTPNQGPKAVHFDAHLEHVRHFLSQQRPIAVSRDGSPIETETEGEEEYPFPDMTLSGSARSTKLVIELPNMPLNPCLSTSNHVCLQSLELAPDGKNLKGLVMVENLSFEKRVAVRFTFDRWQTVSEVTADYLRSSQTPTNTEKLILSVDLFAFTIKLQDVLARIEERQMEIAVRYRAAGGEYWDNNSNANYHVRFKNLRNGGSSNSQQQQQQQHSSHKLGMTRSQTTTGSGGGTQQQCSWATTLRAELDRLVEDDLGVSMMVPKRKGPSASFSCGTTTSSPSGKLDALSAGCQLRAGTGLSARYDFGLSLKQAAALPHAARPQRFLPAIPRPISSVPVEWLGIQQPHHHIQKNSSSVAHLPHNKRWSTPLANIKIPNFPPSPPQDEPSSADTLRNLSFSSSATTTLTPSIPPPLPPPSSSQQHPLHHDSTQSSPLCSFQSGLVTPQSPSLTDDST